jgi:hypothetical protein
MKSSATTCPTESHSPSTWRLTVGYALMLLFAIGLFFVVRHYGERLTPATAVAHSSDVPGITAKPDILLHVLGALVSILLLGRWIGKLCVHFGQPRVIGEIVAGIMLGPSLLGLISPTATPSI